MFAFLDNLSECAGCTGSSSSASRPAPPNKYQLCAFSPAGAVWCGVRWVFKYFYKSELVILVGFDSVHFVPSTLTHQFLRFDEIQIIWLWLSLIEHCIEDTKSRIRLVLKLNLLCIGITKSVSPEFCHSFKVKFCSFFADGDGWEAEKSWNSVESVFCVINAVFFTKSHSR